MIAGIGWILMRGKVYTLPRTDDISNKREFAPQTAWILADGEFTGMMKHLAVDSFPANWLFSLRL